MGSQYYAAVSGGAFAIVIFGAGLVGSRLIAVAERVATLHRERGDLLNKQVSDDDKLQLSWDERGRRDELADLHVLARHVRKAMAAPSMVALLTGVASLSPFVGWPDDATFYRGLVMAGLVVASILWLRLVYVLASDVSSSTRVPYEQRLRQRRGATEAGEPFLVSGDPSAMAAGVDAVERLIGVPSWWRHPVRRFGQSAMEAPARGGTTRRIGGLSRSAGVRADASDTAVAPTVALGGEHDQGTYRIPSSPLPPGAPLLDRERGGHIAGGDR